MDVIVIGNGVLGLTTAYRLLLRDSRLKVTVVGPVDQRGSASRAAAAMFNSFCEVDVSTFKNELERQKFLFNLAATPYWPGFLKQIEEDSQRKLEYGFGTYLINNYTNDSLEDENFEAILSALRQFQEPYQDVAPGAIPCYKPSARSRAGRAILIPGEGWVNPLQLLSALKSCVERSGRANFVDGYCRSLSRNGDSIRSVTLESGEILQGDIYFLAPGATFSKIMQQSDLAIKTPKVFYGIGCSILLKTDGVTLSNCIRTPNRGLACGVYSAPQDKAHTLIGASNFISPSPEDHGRITSIYTLLKAAIEQINSDFYRCQMVRVNVGWRPTSEDTFPLIGKSSISNLWIATGTKRDGLHCSPLISELLTDSILDGKERADAKLFTPERAPIRHLGREEAIRTAVRHTINAAYQHDFTPSKDRMLEDLERHHTNDLNQLHDRVGAYEWGIPPEMINLFRYGHLS